MDLTKFIKDAWVIGQSAKLSGIGFGRILWDNQRDVLADSSDWEYYRFLYGVVSLIGAKRILEIGTHWGGSARAMARAMDEGGRIVTVDINSESDVVLPASPESKIIQKIVGDANSLPVIEQVHGALPSADLIYIDADHAALPTLFSLSVYSIMLRPKVVVVDDITLNQSMAQFWKLAREIYPDRSIDILDVEPAIRAADVGFGLIYMPAGA